MANARTKKTSKKVIKKKTIKKSPAKKPRAKKVMAKKSKAKPSTQKTAARKVGKSPALSTPYSTQAISLASVYKVIDFLRIEVAELKDLVLGKLVTAKQPVNTDVAQTEMFGNEANGSAELTNDDVGNALQEVMTIAGQDEVKKLLAQFKAPKVSAVKEKDFAALIEACALITNASTETQAPEQEKTATSIF